MPILEFKCPKCETKVEQIRYRSEGYGDPICAECNLSMVRVVSKPGYRMDHTFPPQERHVDGASDWY